MAQDLFIAVLAILTVATGVTLLIMLVKRRRVGEERRGPVQSSGIADGASEPQTATAASEARTEKTVAVSEIPGSQGRRIIDDYAIPVSFETARRELDDQVDVGKICPRCGQRYNSHLRFCERDNSELAALN